MHCEIDAQHMNRRSCYRDVRLQDLLPLMTWLLTISDDCDLFHNDRAHNGATVSLRLDSVVYASHCGEVAWICSWHWFRTSTRNKPFDYRPFIGCSAIHEGADTRGNYSSANQWFVYLKPSDGCHICMIWWNRMSHVMDYVAVKLTYRLCIEFHMTGIWYR